MEKLWANSGDSHLIEPDDLFDGLAPDIAARMPRSVKDPDGDFETIHVDGEEFRRRLPRPGVMSAPDGETAHRDDRAPGANDPHLRLKDLDQEGIWAEVIYPSIGIWSFSITDPEVVAAGTRHINKWALDFQRVSPRYVCCASIPLLDIDDAVSEVRWAAENGFHVAFLPTQPPFNRPAWQSDDWDPLWGALEETGMVAGVHIGTEPHRPDQRTGLVHRGPGGAVLNYVETTYGGQRCVTQLIASGALDRHPGLRVLVSEGGATWGPFIADRMDEAYRQHGGAVRPKLSKLPSEYLYSQVYASFQHDRSAVGANAALGWKNVLWGSDYPHYEGTFGHSQETLHGLFDGVDDAVSERIRLGAFEELFPHVPAPPSR